MSGVLETRSAQEQTNRKTDTPGVGFAFNESSRATLVSMRQLPEEIAIKLKAASDAFAHSFDEVRMEDIAAAAGVSRTLLYYYFAGKDDLLAFWLRSLLDDLAVATSAAATSEGDVPSRLTKVIEVQLEHLNAHPATSQMLIANLGRAGKLPDIASRVSEGFEVPVRTLLAEGVADGSLRELTDGTLTATALFGAVIMAGLRYVMLEGSVDVERVAKLITDLFLRGVHIDSASAASPLEPAGPPTYSGKRGAMAKRSGSPG